MPTHNPRIQVTQDRELAAALRVAAPHLPAGLPRSQQVRELAIAGAQHLAAAPAETARRKALLEDLAANFRAPDTAPWDTEALSESKHRAWPIR